MAPRFVLSVEQMRAVDRAAVEDTGLPSIILMENAGRGVAEAILRHRPVVDRGRPVTVRVVIVGGAGNNGGDGFVAARHLALAGAQVRVVLAAPRQKVGGDAAVMLRALVGPPAVPVVELSGCSDAAEWGRALSGNDVVVDALLGTGLRADVAGVEAVAVAAINAAPGWKVAVDVPSGLDADSGRARGMCVRADLTVTMGARKLGLAVDPSAPVGELEVADLGITVAPPTALGPYAFWIDEADVRASLPVRDGSTAHKGTGGHLIVVAGSAGKTGAALLIARAAQRTGAGLVTVASTTAGQAALDAKVVEAMTATFSTGVDDADAGSFDAIAALCRRPHVRAVALGPGIPLGAGMQALVRRLAAELPLPLVIDADGLNLLGTDAAALLAAAPAARIVTPHPGEMARLAGRSTGDVQSERLGVARAFAAASRSIVVLKGARTLVVEPDGTAFINPAVEPALATAGSGDVLTGVVSALLAQGLVPAVAARAAVFLHGCAGAWAGRVHGAPGVIAGDLPDAVAAVRVAWTRESTDTR